ncbi:lysophospholipase L1-like esterase [Arthrobacter silviterrae]|uniref:SGNH/GDSL hydrolase family protein n=1 Tax=Arthrobacter silviterrae TaxID=2026658 RepID=A0ABX0D8V5_9MICC|nr:SGNH/GDSL hydrolase family protein [Arthrobacter silviterrae]MDQ0279613.1 lysophospholipase L1-like esterase [Arthrobacter silviterrae]NGN81910.1 SGNH/GDSL hydrolase family protein [Arthrobacter silviterrae]
MDLPQLRKASLAGAIVAASVAATVGALAVVFRTEGRMAQEAVGHRLGDRGPDADGMYRSDWGRPVRLVMAGDSVADSLGATTAAATLGANLAVALSDHAHRAVELRTIATVGAQTATLDSQLDTLAGTFRPDITVIIVGGNDLTNHVPLVDSIKALKDFVARLRGLGGEVVVGTCPDFDTLPSLPSPLREVGGQLSRRLAGAQFKAAKAAGAHPVLLGRAVRQIFLVEPHDMFAIDGFHPSSLGYRRAAGALVPAVVAAYGEFEAREAQSGRLPRPATQDPAD